MRAQCNWRHTQPTEWWFYRDFEADYISTSTPVFLNLFLPKHPLRSRLSSPAPPAIGWHLVTCKVKVKTNAIHLDHCLGVFLRTAFWPKSGQSALDRASVFGWISKKKRGGSPLISCHFRQIGSLPKVTRSRWWLFFFRRSTQTQTRDLKLIVPTLARYLFCLSALKRIQSYGPLKVPLRTRKGFMDPRLRTTVDSTLSPKHYLGQLIIHNVALQVSHF